MKKLLIADTLHTVLTPIMPYLNRSDIVVHTGGRHDDLVRLHFEHNANLIVTQPELPGMSCESFVNIIRRSETLRNVSILLLVADSPGQQERAARCGANSVLPLSSRADEINERVHGLLNIAPRRAYRVVMNMAVEGRKNNRPFMCNMENISSKGMLVRTREDLSPGDRIRCSFYLPDGMHVNTEGTVVRIVPGSGGLVPKKYGVQFLNMSRAEESAVATFVEKEVQRQAELKAPDVSRIA